MTSAPNPDYPVYASPDGNREQIAATPVQEVRLQHAGWRLKTEPRRKRQRGESADS